MACRATSHVNFENLWVLYELNFVKNTSIHHGSVAESMV
jgi:hypothetical protein